MKMTRRDFLKLSSAAAAACGVTPQGQNTGISPT